MHLTTGEYPREEPRLFKQGQPAGAVAATAARQLHLGSCREGSAQMPRSRSPPEHGLTRRLAGHNAMEHGTDGGRADNRQHSYLQQQDGDAGRQLGHLKPSRIPSLRPRLVQPCRCVFVCVLLALAYIDITFPTAPTDLSVLFPQQSRNVL